MNPLTGVDSTTPAAQARARELLARGVQQESGCLIIPKENPRHYPYLRFEGVFIKASRFLYHVLKGGVPDGHIVCHSCDNPLCINPDHLFVGTHKDNYDDMRLKGREDRARGEGHHRAKLTEADVLEIRRLHAAGGLTQKQIGQRFGIKHPTIGKIVRREYWSHVPGSTGEPLDVPAPTSTDAAGEYGDPLGSDEVGG